MTSYQEARVKLTKTQLNKLIPGTKNKTGTILIITKKTSRWRTASSIISNNKMVR